MPLELIGITVLFFGGFGAAAWFAFERPLRRQGYRWGRRPPTPRPDHRFADGTFTIRGGARSGLVGASMGLATLQADERFIHLTVCAPLRLFGPDVWIDRGQVIALQPVSAALGKGLRFVTADGSLDGVLFFSTSPADLAARLGTLGWPAEAA